MAHDQYSLEELLTDESFQAYALGTDSESEQLWMTWLSQHPHRAQDVHQAAELLRLLAANRQPVPQHIKQQELQKLLQSLEQPTRQVLPAPMTRTRRRSRYQLTGWLALVFALLGGVLYWWQRPTAPAQVSYVTPYGQQRKLVLPDGSEVVLNANSSLRTAAHWVNNQPREVWLKGEAYFDVQHTAPAQLTNPAQAAAKAKFVVHTGTLDVAVLGTKFNVLNRNGIAQVVLNSGKIQLTYHHQASTEQVLMQPGELVEYSGRQQSIRKKSVADPAHYSSWTTGRLSFDNTSLADIVQLLQATYGLEVEVTDPQLLQQKMTGTLPNNNADVLLAALGKALDAQISRQGLHIQIKPAE